MCSDCLAAERPVFLEVEAESAAVIKSPMVVREGRGASGGKLLYADPSLWNRADRFMAFEKKTTHIRKSFWGGLGLAEYMVQAPGDGRYCTWFRCWFLHGGDDSFWFRAGDGKWHNIAQDKHMEWRWIRGPAVTLKAGPNRLQISGREDNSIMDRFVLCDDLRYVPPSEAGRVSAAEPFTIPAPHKPGEPGPNVTYLNHFDDPASAKAVSAKGDPRMGGMYWKLNQPGRFGKGVLVSHPKAYMLMMGEGNASSDDMTIDFWFRSEKGRDIFSDGKIHYLITLQFESWAHVVQGPFKGRRRRGRDKLWVLLDSKNKLLRLDLRPFVRRVAPLDLLQLSTQRVKGNKWRHLILSWEKKTGRFWLALDGKGRTRAVTKDWQFEPVLGIFLGSADYYNVLKPVGGVLDELRIRNVPLSELVSK